VEKEKKLWNDVEIKRKFFDNYVQLLAVPRYLPNPELFAILLNDRGLLLKRGVVW